MTTAPPAVRLQRTIPASAHDAYRAWLDPDLVRRWMAPGSFDASRVEVDERVGGHYRVWHALDGVESGGFEAEILELVPDQRLVFRWGFVGPARLDGPVYDSRLTITFDQEGPDRTTLTLVHERLDQLAAAIPDAAAQVGPGWADVLAKLARLLDPARHGA